MIKKFKKKKNKNKNGNKDKKKGGLIELSERIEENGKIASETKPCKMPKEE